MRTVIKFSIRREVVIYEGCAVYQVTVNALLAVFIRRIGKISEIEY
jgi:hypothetical protein